VFRKMKSLFKKKSTVVEQPEPKREESQLDFPIDRTDYFSIMHLYSIVKKMIFRQKS